MKNIFFNENYNVNDVCRFSEMHSVPGVYFLFKDGAVIYIGQSANIINRIFTHKSRIDFDSFNYIICYDEKTRRVAESEYIDIFLPICNRQQFAKIINKEIRKEEREKNNTDILKYIRLRYRGVDIELMVHEYFKELLVKSY